MFKTFDTCLGEWKQQARSVTQGQFQPDQVGRDPATDYKRKSVRHSGAGERVWRRHRLETDNRQQGEQPLRLRLRQPSDIQKGSSSFRQEKCSKKLGL